jgi:hypothetical protein
MEIPNCGEFRLAPCPRARSGGCTQSDGKCMGHINRTVTCCGDGKPMPEPTSTPTWWKSSVGRVFGHPSIGVVGGGGG